MTRTFRLFRSAAAMALALIALEAAALQAQDQARRRRIAVAANRYGRRSSRRCSTPIPSCRRRTRCS